METKTIKEYVIVGLLVGLLLVVATQPIIVTNVESLNWITEDERYSVSEKQLVGFDEYGDTPYAQKFPHTDGEWAVWVESITEYVGNDSIKYMKISTGEINTIYRNDSSHILSPFVNDDRIVWTDDAYGSLHNIFMYEIDTDTLTQVTWFNTSVEGYKPALNPKLYGDLMAYKLGDYEIYIHDFTTVGDDLCVYCGDEESSVICWDYDGNYVPYSIYIDSTYLYNVEDNTTEDLGLEDLIEISLDDGLMSYKYYDAYYDRTFGAVYEIETNNIYQYYRNEIGNIVYTDLWNGFVANIENTNYTSGYMQIVLHNFNEDLMETGGTQLTNDVFLKFDVVIANGIIMFSEVSKAYDWETEYGTRSDGTRVPPPPPPTPHWEYNVFFMTWDEYAEEQVSPDIETQETYNVNAIYTVIIMSSALAMTVALWVNEWYRGIKYYD